MRSTTNTDLVATNIVWLRQALELVGRLDDATFACAPKNLAGNKVGSHLRHILEFYECFLSGIEWLRIDYDARRRDETVESSRLAASDRIRLLIRRLEHDPRLLEDTALLVRIEDAAVRAGDPWLSSSIGRELQVLSSHTIHHFALLAVTLLAHGVAVDPDFGMSPSTIRFKSTQVVAA
jgi:hypothetical protein